MKRQVDAIPVGRGSSRIFLWSPEPTRFSGGVVAEFFRGKPTRFSGGGGGVLPLIFR